MKTKITIGVVAVFLIGSVVLAIRSNNSSVPSYNAPGNTSAGSESLNPNATGGTTNTTGGTTAGKTYTLAQVATHKDATSCWTAINGDVYDVTTWIRQHPGGADAILSLCGKDGSLAFNNQHGGQRRPANELAGFEIGVLAGATGTSATGTSGTATVPAGVVNNVQDDD